MSTTEETATVTDPTPSRKPRRPRRTPDAAPIRGDVPLGDNTPEPGPDPADEHVVEPAGDVELATAEAPPGPAAAAAALAALGEVPGWAEVLRATLDDQHAQLMAFKQLADGPDPVGTNEDLARALGERDSAMVEVYRLTKRVREFEQAPFVPVGFVAGCGDCTAANTPDPGEDVGPGHHCTACRDSGGEWTPTPHGYDLCPSHLAETVTIALTGGVNAAALAGDADAMLTDPDADLNGEAGELSDEQIEALADRLVELLGESGGWVGVQRRWADIELGAVFLGRKGDLWLVTKAAGEPSEFDKGKVTVKVYGIAPSRNPAEFARSFDADELATVLVPAVERDAIGVLRDQLGRVKLAGAPQHVPAADGA